jgi:hypothetical protein
MGLDERLLKLTLKYPPVGIQSTGCPKKRWKDQYWKRVEEYRLNKPSQQFKKKKERNCYLGA